MNVLYLTNNANRASTTRPTEGWFRQLRPRGLQPVLVSERAGDFHDWATSEGVPAYQIPFPLPAKTNPIPLVKAVWQLRRIVKRHRIELIHCNEQACYPIGSYLAKLMRLPIVVSVHFTMGRGFCEWAFGKHCPERVYFTSEGNLSACRRGISGIVPEQKWYLLNNGIDLSHYRLDASGAQHFRTVHGLGTGRCIGVACALRERKQLEHLFEVGSRLSKDVRILVAGGPIAGEAEYAAKLVSGGKSRIGTRLVSVGHLTDLRPFFSALDLFINTSREEACSLSVLEAMACGCPVVGYASKSVDTQILPGGGEITPQDDIEALAAAVQRWLNDSQRLEQARITSRQRVEEAFDTRKVSNELFDDYQSILESPQKKRRGAILSVR